MGLILYAWEKWRLGWIDDNQVACISSKGTSQHTLSPLGAKGGIKIVNIKLSESTVLAIELRTKTGLDVDTCSQGLLFYIVDMSKLGGKGPITVVDPRATKVRACSAQRGGQLSAAAMDFAKGEKDISLLQYGVRVLVTGTDAGRYKFSVTQS